MLQSLHIGLVSFFCILDNIYLLHMLNLHQVRNILYEPNLHQTSDVMSWRSYIFVIGYILSLDILVPDL